VLYIRGLEEHAQRGHGGTMKNIDPEAIVGWAMIIACVAIGAVMILTAATRPF
jgi:hypothetical protein